MSDAGLDLRQFVEERRRHWEAVWTPAFQVMQDLINQQQKGRTVNVELEIIEVPDEDIDPAMRAYQGLKNDIARKIGQIWSRLETDEVEGSVVEPLENFLNGLAEVEVLTQELIEFCRTHRWRLEAGPGDHTLEEAERSVIGVAVRAAEMAERAASILNNGIPEAYRVTPEAMVERITGHATYLIRHPEVPRRAC